jgi:3-hydroxyacyl-[acyl-carrier-protein] dehydratase
VLEHAHLRSILPHGHPVLLVDRLSLEPDGSAVGTKAITAGEPCYADLPPDAEPERFAYPVSLLLESFGQTAAALWLTRDGDGTVADDQVLMLVAARGCRIEGRAFPGDVLRHAARIEHVFGDNVFVSGETHVDGRRVAVVESMMAVARPRAEILEVGDSLA